MNIGRFILNVVVAYVLFAALYSVLEMFVMADQMAAMKDLMRPEEEITIVYLYYLVQTVVFVWLFGKVCGSADLKGAAVFGGMMGLYLSAVDAVMRNSIKVMPTDSILPHTLANLVIMALVAMVLAFMWGKGWGAGEKAA